MGQSVDIVAMKGERLFLFETKLSNWRRAIEQASSHVFVADFVYIVLPKKCYSTDLYALAASRGIGVIEVDAECLVWNATLKASRSRRIWRPQRAQFQKHMEAIQYAG